MILRIPFALVLALCLPAPAAAQSALDSTLQADAARTVSSYPRLTIFDDVAVEVEGAIVTLTGKVTMPFKRDDLGARVERLAGVAAVRNHIAVLPLSPDDDDLRQRLARAVYSHPAFQRYAALPYPPIRIVVEHGDVTLTGLVPREVDRALARSLASGQGARSLNCRLQVETERTRGAVRPVRDPGRGPAASSTRSAG